MELVLDFRPTDERPADLVERERLEQLAACFQLFLGHELPNTLVSLQGFARLLAGQRDRLDDDDRALLDRLAVLAHKADSTSRQLAEIGRLLREPAFGHAIDPGEVIREAVAEVNARRPGRPLAAPAAGPARVTASRPLLCAVLVQLLGNAVRAAPEGGVEIGQSAEPGGVRLAVRDRGKGMSDAQRRLLDEPFAAGRQPGAAGLGLGFFLVRQAAAKWGGVLRLESAPERGTSVELFLPAPEAAAL